MHKLKKQNCPVIVSQKFKFEQPFHLYSIHLSSGDYRKSHIILKQPSQKYGEKIQKNYLTLTGKWHFLNNFCFWKLTHKSIDWYQRCMITMGHSCLYFISISCGLMIKPIGFLSVHPIKSCWANDLIFSFFD